MRQLRLLNRTDDGERLLVETDDGLERFTLPVDATLRAALSTPARSSAPATPEPARLREAAAAQAEIGPREIQVRVRAGESPEDLAAEHGMSLERVMRFATPVVAERARITDEARRARARRTNTDGGEPAIVQFGEAVEARFTAHGIDVTTVSWDSRRRDDGAWLIVASWLGGDGEYGAEWSFDRTSRSVAPLDDTAADLLSDRPIRPVTPPPPVAVVPRLASGVIAFPPFPEAHTGPIQRVEDVFDQDAPVDGPIDLPPYVPQATPAAPAAPAPPVAPVAPAAAAAAAGVVAEDVRIDGDLAAGPVPDLGLPLEANLEFEEPPLPLAISDAEGRPAAAKVATLHTLGSRREETEDDKASRARIPSWDDILLGVRRKQD